MAAVELLSAARAAFERGAWETAFAAFTGADEASTLAAEDLEDWATTAYLTGREQEFSRLLDRAHQRYLDRGDTLRAAFCACWLGLMLAGISAHAQAGGWTQRARRLLADYEGRPSAGDGASQDDDSGNFVYGYLRLAEALAAVGAGRIDEAFALGQRAVDLATARHDADLSALALQLLGRIQLRRAFTDEGYALLDEAMSTVASGALSPQVAGIVYCSVIDGCRAGFSLSRAHEWTLALTRLCETQPELIAFSSECHASRAEMHVLHGAWPEALREAEEALRRPAPWAARKVAATAYYQRAEVHRLRGEFAAAEAAYEAAGRAGGRRQPGLALLRAAQGELTLAASAIDRVLEESSDPLQRVRYLPVKVSIALAGPQPDVDGARGAAAELADIAAAHGTSALSTMAAHTAGEVELAAGDAVAAVGALRTAVDGWLELEAPYQVARARLLLGSACRLLGDEEAAGHEFALAEEGFTELGANTDLRDLAALRTQRAGGPGLSARELQVLKLLVAGETNRAIGSALSISERTVDRHVSNIFDKLGVGSRTEAATYAVRHDLV